MVGVATDLVEESTTLIRSNTCSSGMEVQEDLPNGADGTASAKFSGEGGHTAGKNNVGGTENIREQKDGDNSSLPVKDSFQWSTEELKKFWLGCFPNGYDVYAMDGLHPKALCSKICNDVLKTNINLHSSNSNPNDKILCFDVLSSMEKHFIEAEIISPPTQKPGNNPNHKAYKRVMHADFNRMGKILGEKTLEAWAREVVNESVNRLTNVKKRAT